MKPPKPIEVDTEELSDLKKKVPPAICLKWTEIFSKR
jgi:hypothetical protein